jgi:mono/diheme cytochrome c family protein
VRSRLRLAALSAVALLTGCNWYYYTLPSPDDLMAAIPWFDHMIGSRAIHPYARADIPRQSVPGTVPITGAEADWSAEFLAGNPATADRLVNPTVAVATLARGDTLYHTFCSVCHGPSGAVTDATVGPRLGAQSLLTDRARALSDGYLYSIIRYGRGLMPRYGDKLYRPEDRWAVVHYVRRLQQAAPAGAGPVAPATPTATPRD